MNQTIKLIMVYITTNSFENAQKIATTLLEKKLVACSNIIGENNPITSIYSWDNKINIDKYFKYIREIMII